MNTYKPSQYKRISKKYHDTNACFLIIFMPKKTLELKIFMIIYELELTNELRYCIYYNCIILVMILQNLMFFILDI